MVVGPVTDSVVPMPVAVRVPPVKEKFAVNWLAPPETVRLPPERTKVSAHVMLLTVRVPDAVL